ncbi:MAG: response regulator [Planctomycetaceae bacterium]
MSREAIESFVDEIRDELPRMRRAFAIMHACLDDREALFEAHRLTHSIKGTAALVRVMTLSRIADLQEQLLERIMDGRLTMDDLIRDTLERLTDITEAFADGLLAGNVPEDRLLAEAVELCRRHDEVAALGESLLPSPETPIEGLPNNVSGTALDQWHSLCEPNALASGDSPSNVTQSRPVASAIGSPAPISTLAPSGVLDDIPSKPMLVSGRMELSVWDVFRIEAIGNLRGLMQCLDTYRGDLTRWDVLADACRRFGLLKQEASAAGVMDIAELSEYSAALLQRVLDRTIPPNEQIADCLQGCVDALEQRLDEPPDEVIQQLLLERIAQLGEVEPPEEPVAVTITESPASELVGEPVEERQLNEPTDTNGTAISIEPVSCEPPTKRTPTPPASIELDDRGPLSEEMLEVFTEEAEDHLRLIFSAFANLEKNPARMSSIQEVRRSAHTIKGAAGSVGLRLVSKLSHRMEDLLERLFAVQQPVSTGTLALLYDTTDALQDLVHGDYAAEGMRFTIAQLYDSYDAVLSGSDSGREPKAESVERVSQPAVEISEPIETTEPTIVATTDEVVAQVVTSSEPDEVAMWRTRLACEDGPTVVTSMELEKVAAADDLRSGERSDAGELPRSGERGDVADVPPATPHELVVEEFLPMLAAWNRLSVPVSVPAPQPAESLTENGESKRQGESLRVPLSRLDSLMREVSELIINRSAFEQRMTDFARCVDELQRSAARMKTVAHDLDVKYGVGALGGRRPLWGNGSSAKFSSGDRHGVPADQNSRPLPDGRGSNRHEDEFDALEFDRYTEFHLLSRSLSESASDMGTVGNELRNVLGDFDQLLNRQGRLSRDTQDRLMRIRLVPLATLATKLHRTVRVVAGQQHKDVDFLIQGGDTELDKVVLEELADPLMHLLRNAVDHGLETTEVRRAANKPEQSKICVQAFSQGTQVVLRISDDGAGLNFDAIRETAARHGLVPASDAANLKEEELASFIFLPGFSTSREITEVSGRGVGMDIVRDKVQKLKGTVSVESRAGQGTTFTIRLPMTLAVTRALLVHAAHETFALPMQSVVQILRLERKQIEQLGPSPVIRLGEEALPLVYLSERLRLRTPIDKTSASLPVLILAAGDQKVAVAVDKILAGRDIVVKSLGSHLRKVKGLIGATLMGDGSVVPILDAGDLVGHAGTVTRSHPVVPAPHRPMPRHEEPLLMVVDDSVSVRRVMMNLLKNAGWQILEAKDGLDALEKLQQATRQPNLFLLDIEMPRMDGYELLTSLRSQTEHHETPIVMVTSRAGDKHRQKAMQLGASDYVIKPYQDNELLTLIRSLLAAQREAVLA